MVHKSMRTCSFRENLSVNYDISQKCPGYLCLLSDNLSLVRFNNVLLIENNRCKSMDVRDYDARTYLDDDSKR